MIKFEEGSVCYAYGHQWKVGDKISSLHGLKVIDHDDFIDLAEAVDFELNEPREGWYIPKSELDTEEKYNDAVEVFELFGFSPYLNCDMDKSEFIKQALNYGEGLIADDELDLVIDYNGANDISQKIRKLTYPQLMAIGKLKRAMIEKSAPKITPDLTPDNRRRNKSKQAYYILNGLDYEYDLIKQQWFKKQYI